MVGEVVLGFVFRLGMGILVTSTKFVYKFECFTQQVNQAQAQINKVLGPLYF
jgi:hypothetical protein